MKFIGRQQEMREGGENDREMVEGIADILTQVEDPANRKAIAENMVADFKAEGVSYNLQDFLQRAQVEMDYGGEPKPKKGKKPQQVKPFVTSDPAVYRYRKAAYDDSLHTYQMAPELKRKETYIDAHSSSMKDNRQQLFKLWKQYEDRGFNFDLGYNQRTSPKKRVSDGVIGHQIYDYKKPVQRVVYKPEPFKAPKNDDRPLYVSDPNDPRLKAYKDSLALVDQYYDRLDKLGDGEWMDVLPKGYTQKHKAVLKKLKQSGQTIMPVAFQETKRGLIPVYEEPKREVIYRPSKPKPKAQTKLTETSTVTQPQQEPEEIMQPMQTLRPGLITMPPQQLATMQYEDEEPAYEETEGYAEGEPDGPGAEWVGRTERYIDWDGNSASFKLPRFRKPGHSGPLLKPGKKHYFHYPSIESRYQAEIIPEEEEEFKNGGQHGGLDRWFAEKWVDVKTGKECGRQKGEKRRSYPACRPSKRVSEDTPKTASELSDSEKEKFKRTKTSSERIPYQHRRRDEGGEMTNDMDYMKEGGNVPTNPELWSRAKAAAKAKYDVYPSAYANGFAAKWYKERGGGWKKAEYGGCMECGGQMAEGGQMMEDPNTMDQNQQQSGIEAALNEVATMIMNGEDPESVVKEMMGEGVPQETAVQLVQEAMNRLQDDDETEEEDTPMSSEEIDELVNPMQGDEPDGNDYKTGGSIKLDPAKKGTFKAQATRMGMSVQEAATYILKNKEEFSPAMVKKANFAKNFAKELGGEMPEFKNGGGIPARYKKQGFTRVGAKRKSTRPGKKWMVLAKKGDQYKIVHGGYKGMKDYTQHHNNKRRDRFWDRMGGRDSAKARDPFSPLYWHKRFGTWAEGGPFMEGDTVVDQTTQHTVANLENNAWNRGLAAANTLGDPRMMAWALPNKGLLGKVKAAAGLASGLSGAILGYEKLFAGDKTDSKLANTNTGEYGNTADILDKRDQAARRAAMLAQKMPTSTLSPTSGSGLAGMEAQWKDKDVFGPGYLDAGFAFGGELPRADEGGDFREWFIKNAQRPDVMANAANQSKLMEMWRAETGQAAAAPVNTAGPRNTVPPTVTPTPAQTTVQGDPFQENQLFKFTERGDSVGMLAANNALAGFGMLNSVLGEEDRQKEYEQMMRRTGNSDARYKSYNPTNPFGNYTLNAGPASNFGLVANTPVQDFGTRMSGAKYGGQFAEGGEYYVSDKELKMILAMGGEIEFLD